MSDNTNELSELITHAAYLAISKWIHAQKELGNTIDSYAVIQQIGLATTKLKEHSNKLYEIERKKYYE